MESAVDADDRSSVSEESLTASPTQIGALDDISISDLSNDEDVSPLDSLAEATADHENEAEGAQERAFHRLPQPLIEQ